MKKARFSYSDEMKQWMKEHYKLTRHELTDAFNGRFNTNRSRENISDLRKSLGLRTRQSAKWQKGDKPVHAGTQGVLKASLGSFKKGHLTWNKQPVGTERINGHGYVDVKLSDPGIWKPKHHLIWEKHHGKRPENSVITFKDCNRLNCDIDNLILITRAEHTIVDNTNRKLKGTATEFKPVLINLAKIKHAIATKTTNDQRPKRGKTNA
ncbi:HNH endonuclease signature motif containing protein [Xenorhabdus bovienii]|uniref:HNH endonuclease signature motif containing protein n=1 Tax=Xenorhabdus bovienii TaxID=40576 RepID=UPI00237CF613|nr:HNH endonuclease signature motif containing protein [Xenorhabdus bovienii]MDE1484534.1 HNH endonuclease [Xenorhabdus bovienii]MDE9443702.1 HNH endonuclease [Xenorhabdus bovienii]